MQYRIFFHSIGIPIYMYKPDHSKVGVHLTPDSDSDSECKET